MDIVRKRRKPIAEINVVPYIDVMLVLLIVFMITAPLLTQGVQVELPSADTEPLEIDENTETLVVSISAQGEYFISLGAVSEDDPQPVDLEKILRDVNIIVKANPTISVYIETDTNASAGHVVSLLAVLQKSGVSPYIITQPLE